MNLHNNEAGRRVGFDNKDDCDKGKTYFSPFSAYMCVQKLKFVSFVSNFFRNLSLMQHIDIVANYTFVVGIVFLCHGDYFAMWFGGRSLV